MGPDRAPDRNSRADHAVADLLASCATAPGCLVLPWAYVQPDNHRLMPIRQGKSMRLITAPKYREAQTVAARLLVLQWGSRPQLTGPVEVHGIAWFPDRRKRDVGNFHKQIGDCLTGIAFADDSQIHREVWELGGIDRDHPRLELHVAAYQRAAA